MKPWPPSHPHEDVYRHRSRPRQDRVFTMKAAEAHSLLDELKDDFGEGTALVFHAVREVGLQIGASAFLHLMGERRLRDR